MFDSIFTSQISVKNQLKTTVYIAKQDQKIGPKKILNFYVKSFIINKTNQNLVFYHLDDGKIYRIAGQKTTQNDDLNVSKILLLDTHRNIIVSFPEYPQEVSNELQLSTLGNYTLEIKIPERGNKNNYEMHEFGATVRLIRSGKLSLFIIRVY